MNASTLRACAVLALLCLCIPLKADSFTTIPFSGYVSQVDLFYDPQGTVYQPPVPRVSVGDLLTGSLSKSVFDLPGGSTITTWGLSGSSGTWFGHDSSPGIFSGPGQLFFQHFTAQQGIYLTLIDPNGGTNWQSGTFSATDQNGYPYSWWRFTATINQIPDGGNSAAMLGVGMSFLGLAFHVHRRRALRGIVELPH
jgi:hypothetical protein